jgi:hypothetical protein
MRSQIEKHGLEPTRKITVDFDILKLPNYTQTTSSVLQLALETMEMQDSCPISLFQTCSSSRRVCRQGSEQH